MKQPGSPDLDPDQLLRRRAEALAAESPSPAQISPPAPTLEESQRLLHELQVYQIELRMQNDELRRAQLELDNARAHYFDLYDLAPVGYCTLSEKGLIQEANLTAAGLLDLPRSALLQQLLSRFILDEDQDIYYLHMRKLQHAGRRELGHTAVIIFELRMQRQDGAPFWVQLALTTPPGASRTPASAELYRVAIIDITERKLTEQALSESEEKYRLLFENELYAIVIADQGTLCLLDANAAAIRMFGYSREEMFSGLTVADVSVEVPTSLETIQQSIQQGNKFVPLRQFRRQDESTFPGEMVIGSYTWRGRPVLFGLIHDISQRHRAELEAERLLHELQQLNAGLEERVAQRTAELRLANQALQVEIAAQQQAQEQARQHAAHTAALGRTSALLNAQLDLDKVLKTVCEETARALNVEHSQVLLMDEVQNLLRLAADFGFPAGQPQFQAAYPVSKIPHRPPQAGFTDLVLDLRDAPGQPNSESYAALGLRTLLCAGMYHNQELVGVLNIYSKDKVRSFSASEINLLQGLAALAAQAIVNAHLYEQVTAGREQLIGLSRDLLEAQEKERRSLALELHDEFGQLLSSIKMSLDMIPALEAAEASQQLDRARALTDGLIKRVRRRSLELRPSMLDDLGLLPALDWLFENFYAQTGERVVFDCQGLDRRFTPQVEITMYRIIQEALTNILRHAGKARVAVSAWTDEECIHMRIIDSGIGLNVQEILSKQPTSGLSGMRERIRMLEGDLVIESAPGAGTTVTTRLPYTRFPARP